MMTILEREGGFRCRRRSWKPGLVVCIFLLALTNVHVNACGYNETPQCKNSSNPSDCSCVKCLDCPPGQGLYPQCGIPLKENMTMKCLPCKSGTYSNVDDFGSCHACDVCIGQETLRKCNATHNTICKESCMDGFSVNKIFGTCEKIIPTPRKERTTSPPHKPTTGPSVEVPTLTSTNTSSNIASGPNETISTTTMRPTRSQKPTARPTADDALPTLTSSNLTGNDSGPNKTVIKTIERIARTSDMVYVWAICILLPLAILFGAYICFKERKKIKLLLTGEQIKDPIENSPMITIVASDEQRGDMHLDRNVSSPRLQGQDLEEIISSPSDQQTVDHAAGSSPPEQPGEGSVEEANVIFDIPNLCGRLLRDLSAELKESISIQISDPALKGWNEVGRILEVDNDTLEKIRISCSYGSSNNIPGEHLFINLVGVKPQLTVKEFIEALESIKRKDVVDYIYKTI